MKLLKRGNDIKIFWIHFMMLVTAYKALRKFKTILVRPIYSPIARLLFYLNGAVVDKGLKVRGFLQIEVTRRGALTIGKSLHLNSGQYHNVIGRQQNCIFWVEGALSIGNNVGMSSSAIICNHQISIGNNVTIGGNTVIYDTDFHVLDSKIRNDKSLDKQGAKKAPVCIGDNVFIGAHATILKGVTIGANSIVGACAVITKDVPANEIWAGNPAKFIRKLNV
jgi:acetyltransferase-like isoleucine patch superfamily enzyme